MKCHCPISGLIWNAEYMSASHEQAHPFFSLPLKKIPAFFSIWQSGRISPEETHLLFTRMLLDTEHVTFSTPLEISEQLLAIENAQMIRLSKLAYSGAFQKETIDLPGFLVSKSQQDISELIDIWETELENYRVSYLAARQSAEVKAMATRVNRAFSNPVAKGRKQIISSWMLKVVSLPDFITIHPITRQSVPIADYWIELLHKAIDNDSMLSYPEADIVEFKDHLEENLPLNYAQEFSLLEELRRAISRKQNYFGYSFTDIDDAAYSVEKVKPTLNRADFPSVTAFLSAIKSSRNHIK